MKKNIVSAAHSLSLVSVSNVLSFGVVHSRAFVKSIGEAEEIKIIPGSFVPGDGLSDGLYNKKHSFKLSDVSVNKTDYLENLKKAAMLLFMSMRTETSVFQVLRIILFLCLTRSKAVFIPVP